VTLVVSSSRDLGIEYPVRGGEHSVSLTTMNAPAVHMRVAVNGPLVCVKISGRACFAAGPSFKTLTDGLCQRGHTQFLFDLTECQQMDSTLLGMLAGLAIRLAQTSAPASDCAVKLLNASDHITELLESVGVDHLFTVLSDVPLNDASLAPVRAADSGAGRQELAKASLEAHRTLMELHPGNVPKFKDVAQFLAEDLKKMEE
jgi:anti-anti-sigma regulatory factor